MTAPRDALAARRLGATAPIQLTRRYFVPPQTSVAYFDALTAPSKKLVWFERSGHEPFVDEPDKFNAAMAETVRPALPPDPLAT